MFASVGWNELHRNPGKDSLLVWPDDSSDLARGWQFLLLRVDSVEGIQILQAGSCTEQHNRIVGIEEAGVAELAIGRECGRPFGSREYTFDTRPMPYGIGDFFFRYRNRNPTALAKDIEDDVITIRLRHAQP